MLRNSLSVQCIMGYLLLSLFWHFCRLIVTVCIQHILLLWEKAKFLSKWLHQIQTNLLGRKNYPLCTKTFVYFCTIRRKAKLWEETARVGVSAAAIVEGRKTSVRFYFKDFEVSELHGHGYRLKRLSVLCFRQNQFIFLCVLRLFSRIFCNDVRDCF